MIPIFFYKPTDHPLQNHACVGHSWQPGGVRKAKAKEATSDKSSDAPPQVVTWRICLTWISWIHCNSEGTCRSLTFKQLLVGGFNPFEKYQSKWESSPTRGENKTYLKPPPWLFFFLFFSVFGVDSIDVIYFTQMFVSSRMKFFHQWVANSPAQCAWRQVAGAISWVRGRWNKGRWYAWRWQFC